MYKNHPSSLKDALVYKTILKVIICSMLVNDSLLNSELHLFFSAEVQ